MFGHYPAYPKGLDQTHTEMSRGNVKKGPRNKHI